MRMDKFVGFLGVEVIGECPVAQRPDVVEGVVTHLMTFGHNTIVQVVVLEHIFTHHEESCFDVELAECVENEGSGLGDGAVIECQIDCMFILPHPPSRLGVKPTQPFCRLFDNHGFLPFVVLFQRLSAKAAIARKERVEHFGLLYSHVVVYHFRDFYQMLYDPEVGHALIL